jgi:hypothetical protein
MTIGFGNDHEVHWSNGQASRILRAMGYPVSEESSGSWPIEKMKSGIALAIQTLTGEDLDALQDLATLVDEYEIGGEPTMEWG